MTQSDQQAPQPLSGRLLPWLIVGLAGIAAPAVAMAMPGLPSAAMGPVLAIGLMATGMIGAAVAGRLQVGLTLALLSGLGLVLLGGATPAPPLDGPLAALLAVSIASFSFAARGALFYRSAAPRGWWVAVAVVAGEAAMLATAAARPGALPDWLLALLPAQWANTAIGAALGDGRGLAAAELIALAGTAAATMLVTRLLPRRWPYLIMFSVWLGLSALVLHSGAA